MCVVSGYLPIPKNELLIRELVGRLIKAATEQGATCGDVEIEYKRPPKGQGPQIKAKRILDGKVMLTIRLRNSQMAASCTFTLKPPKGKRIEGYVTLMSHEAKRLLEMSHLVTGEPDPVPTPAPKPAPAAPRPKPIPPPAPLQKPLHAPTTRVIRYRAGILSHLKKANDVANYDEMFEEFWGGLGGKDTLNQDDVRRGFDHALDVLIAEGRIEQVNNLDDTQTWEVYIRNGGLKCLIEPEATLLQAAVDILGGCEREGEMTLAELRSHLPTDRTPTTWNHVRRMVEDRGLLKSLGSGRYRVTVEQYVRLADDGSIDRCRFTPHTAELTEELKAQLDAVRPKLNELKQAEEKAASIRRQLEELTTTLGQLDEAAADLRKDPDVRAGLRILKRHPGL